MFEHILIDRITPDPENPRKNFVQSEFDQLVESVKAKGIIQPITIRPTGDGSYMIVAGERRWRAAKEAGLDSIPAMIRETDDAEAFRIQMIENLIRADITELEEATGFDKYLNQGEDFTVEDLSAKTGFDPRFIRRRVAILKLPEKILKMWEQDKLSFAALEQLLRVDNPEEVLQQCSWSPTAKNIAEIIERRAPSIKDGVFDKKECNSCPANTKVQKSLFGDDFAADKIRCLKPECFLGKQKEALIEKHKDDRGVLIVDRPDYTKAELVKTRKQCAECEHFHTEIEIMTSKARTICAAKACPHDKKAKEAEEATGGRVAKPEKAKERFYKEALEDVEIPEEKQFRTAILMMIETDGRFRSAAFDVLKIGGNGHTHTDRVIEAIEKFNDDPKLLAAMVTRFATRDGYSGKQALCEWLGHSINEGFVIDEWYLKRKDKIGLIELAREFKILQQFKENIRAAKPEFNGDYDSIQKKVMVEALLSCDLDGKIPKEIRG